LKQADRKSKNISIFPRALCGLSLPAQQTKAKALAARKYIKRISKQKNERRKMSACEGLEPSLATEVKNPAKKSILCD